MRKLLLLSLSVAAITYLSAEQAFAQGQGAGKSLSALSRAASHAGGSHGLQKVTRVNGVGRASAGIGHAAAGLQRANAAVSRIPNLGVPTDGVSHPLSNQERILDHRLNQAEHLRAIAERNGNQNLLDTADRMDANAIQNYTRQNGAPPPDVATPTPLPDDMGTTLMPEDSVTTVTATVQVPTPRVSAAKRGFWFQSR